jgi:membrane-anchored protein YejM (alkaline phosphatase superfamily)
MKQLFLLLTIAFFINLSQLYAQKQTKTENIFLITVDGLRWQEVFKGADSLFIDDTGMVENTDELMAEYWDSDPIIRRKRLMPFFWEKLSAEGQLYGNRVYGNLVDNSNTMLFSYPGYNEVLSGFADDKRINSNSKINNPNTTLLEYLNQTVDYQNKVLAYGSWDVFPFIINEERSKVPVNAGFDLAEGNNLTDKEVMINRLQSEIRGPWGGVRLDAFTHNYALEGIKKHQPKVVYIAYGEPDDWAHDNAYDQYLYSIHQFDAYLKELWEYIQNSPQYKDRTTMIITTDHGRGTNKKTWTGHGSSIPEAKEIWMAAIGPDTPAKGELKTKGLWHSSMIARTIFKLLGKEYPDVKAGEAITDMTSQ